MNTSPNPRLAVKIIGVGGAGGNVVERIQSTELAALPAMVLHTNPRVLPQWQFENKLLIGEKQTRGLGSGGDPELGKLAAGESIDIVTAFCKDTDLVFLVAGLGGGTGSGAAPAIAKAAREAGALVLCLATLPFDFEGPRRASQARAAMAELKQAADAVICLPNQRMTRIFDANTPVREAFHMTNDLLGQGMHGIWRMLSQSGLVNVDFAYLYSIVRGQNSESAFASAEAPGEMRARDVVEKLCASPLLDEGRLLTQATDILVSLVGGPDMTIADVNKVMEQLQRKAEGCNIVMGAAIDDTFANRLSLTVIVTARNVAQEEAAPATAPTRGTRPAVGLDQAFLNPASAPKAGSRFVAPPPATTPEKAAELLQRQQGGSRVRRNNSKMKQQTLALEIVSKGRFEKSEPTIHRGEDLDVPTYVRRGVALN